MRWLLKCTVRTAVEVGLLDLAVQAVEWLETEQEEIGEAVTEVRRRIQVLDEVMSWSVTEEEPKKEFPLVDGLPKEKESSKRNFAPLPLLVSGTLVILLAIAIAFSGYYYYVMGRWQEYATQLQSQLAEQQTFLEARISEPSDESLSQSGDAGPR